MHNTLTLCGLQPFGSIKTHTSDHAQINQLRACIFLQHRSQWSGPDTSYHILSFLTLSPPPDSVTFRTNKNLLLSFTMAAFDSLSYAVPTKNALARDLPLMTMHWQDVLSWNSVSPFKAREGKDGEAMLGFETQLNEPSMLARFALCCTYPSFVMNVTDLQGDGQRVASIEHTASCCDVGRLRVYAVNGSTSELVGEVTPTGFCSDVGQITNASAEPVGRVSYTQWWSGNEELALEGALSRRGCSLSLADQPSSQPPVYEMRSEEVLSEAEKLLLIAAVLFGSLQREEWAV